MPFTLSFSDAALLTLEVKQKLKKEKKNLSITNIKPSLLCL